MSLKEDEYDEIYLAVAYATITMHVVGVHCSLCYT